MIEALAWALTVIPVLAASFLGCRAGAWRLLALGGPIAVGWAAAIAAMLVGFWARWFQPFGFVTPAILGLVVAVAARQATRRKFASLSPQARAVGRPARAVGALLGAGGGSVAVASLWLGVALASATLTPPGSSSSAALGPDASEGTSMFQALFQTANRGFIRHLPLVGSLGDEVEALTYILNTDPHIRAELAFEEGWENLAELPSLQVIVKNQETLDEIDRVGSGDMAALYRLQKNPLILDFLAEPDVQKLLLETRPTTVAKQLAALLARKPTQPGSSR